MKVICNNICLCKCCMRTHEVSTVEVQEQVSFKEIQVDYTAQYQYCDVAQEYYATEEQMNINDISLKNAYRKSQNLLSTDDIIAIRNMYGISQKDFCVLLGWGHKTITRYEGHQVQDKAHDCILRKLQNDPEWFIELLDESRDEISEALYNRYYNNALVQYSRKQKNYIKKALEAQYAMYQLNKSYNGNADFSLDKVISAMDYIERSENMKDMSMVKLMKLLWYSDMVSYARNNEAVTGLVYKAAADGAEPVGQEFIIDIYNTEASRECKELSLSDKVTLDYVINRLGVVNQEKIISLNRSEQAYIQTKPNDIILFGKTVSINA